MFVGYFSEKQGAECSEWSDDEWVSVVESGVLLPKQRGLKKLFSTFCILDPRLCVVGVEQHFCLEEGGQERDIFRGDVEGDGQQVFLIEASDVVVKKIAEGLFRHLLRHCPPRQLRSLGCVFPVEQRG